MDKERFRNNLLNGVAPFYVELKNSRTVQINGNDTLVEYYKLLISKRDFAMFCAGLKPHKGWSFNETKKYYGISGDRDRALSKITDLSNCFTNLIENSYDL